jgi:hypothetical protein
VDCDHLHQGGKPVSAEDWFDLIIIVAIIVGIYQAGKP